MSTNPYKAFVPCLVTSCAPATAIEDHEVTDPTAGDWRRVGLCEPIKGEGFIVDLQGAGKLMAVQFNERILPGKVRDEQVAKEVAKVEKRDGRKISKKEFAQLREQVEFDLLPRAFIRRTVVPIFFVTQDLGKQFMLVCTSSAKRADDCVAVMLGAYPDLQPTHVTVEAGVALRLKTLAIDGVLFDEDTEQETGFFSHDSIALKGNEKKVIRVKDKPIDDSDVQDLIKLAEYAVVEMGVGYSSKAQSDDLELTFIVNDHLIFKRIALPGIKTTMLKEDLFGYTVLCVQTYRQMLVRFIRAFGGLAGTQGADEDDEL